MENNYLFLIKGHYWGKSNVNMKNRSNVIDVSKNVSDIQDLLIHTGTLITDYSSVLFDFVLLDRPIILYPYDFEEFLENRSMYYDYYQDLPGPFAKNEADLFGLIKAIDSVFNNKEYKERYQKFKDRFNFYKDGKSCERLYEYLLKIGKTSTIQ